MDKPRGLLARALMSYPTTHTDVSLEELEKRYKVGGLLNREAAAQAVGSFQQLLAYKVAELRKAEPNMSEEDLTAWAKRLLDGKEEFRPLRALHDNLTTDDKTLNRTGRDLPSYWPEFTEVQYAWPWDDRLMSGANGYVEHSAPNIANVSYRTSDSTLPHELHHTYQLNNPRTENRTEKEMELLKKAKDIAVKYKDDLPTNAFESEMELTAALKGLEGGSSSKESVKDIPVLNAILSDPELAAWYLSKTQHKKK